MIVLAVISAVDAGLWACAAGSPWWLSLLSILLAVLGAVVVFLLAVYASDPAQPLLRWVALVLFLLVGPRCVCDEPLCRRPLSPGG